MDDLLKNLFKDFDENEHRVLFALKGRIEDHDPELLKLLFELPYHEAEALGLEHDIIVACDDGKLLTEDEEELPNPFIDDKKRVADDEARRISEALHLKYCQHPGRYLIPIGKLKLEEYDEAIIKALYSLPENKAAMLGEKHDIALYFCHGENPPDIEHLGKLLKEAIARNKRKDKGMNNRRY